MPVTNNSFTTGEQTYQRQMTSYRRTRVAIMESALKSLESQGFSATSMIDIADRAQVSRATLYNHFRDKGSVYLALAEFEVSRTFEEVRKLPSRSDALAHLAKVISGSAFIPTLRSKDPALITDLITNQAHPLWAVIRADMTEIFGDQAEIALTWIIGQVFVPVRSEAIEIQARALVGQ